MTQARIYHPPSELDASEEALLREAEHAALRDINITGEFNNPFHPHKDRLRYRAYKSVERWWNDEQLDLDYQQREEQYHESKL